VVLVFDFEVRRLYAPSQSIKGLYSENRESQNHFGLSINRFHKNLKERPMKKQSTSGYVYLILMAAFLLSYIGCANITRNMQSTTQKEIDKTPYFRNFSKDLMLSSTVVKILPATLENKKDWFSPSLKPLLLKVNKYLKTKEYAEIIEPFQITHQGEPELVFGDKSILLAQSDDEKKNSIPAMTLIVTQPSIAWQEKWQTFMEGKTDYTIKISLGVSAYRVNQKNWKGSKEIQIGTGYSVNLPWLTSLDDPIPVVQLTGALLDKNGKIIRAGAEGIFVKKTSFVKSLVGWTDLISKEDVEKISNKHLRKDLANKPLAWQVAVQNLIANLLNRSDLIVD